MPMMRITRNPYRWILALLLILVMPALTLWFAYLGASVADHMFTLGFPFLLDNPWVFILFAVFYPALIFGTIIHMFTRSKYNKSETTTA